MPVPKADTYVPITIPAPDKRWPTVTLPNFTSSIVKVVPDQLAEYVAIGFIVLVVRGSSPLAQWRKEQSGPKYSGYWVSPAPRPTAHDESHKQAKIISLSQAVYESVASYWYTVLDRGIACASLAYLLILVHVPWPLQSFKHFDLWHALPVYPTMIVYLVHMVIACSMKNY